MPDKWEYRFEIITPLEYTTGDDEDMKRVNDSVTQKLNEFGAEGWEVFKMNPALTAIGVHMKRRIA
jgi:hypothetical protein